MKVMRPLTRANVLAKVNQFDIFNCYCTPFTKLNKSFRSELRDDKRPTCSICKVGDKLVYRDFAIVERSMDCFNYIQEKYSVNFSQALEMINQDFNLGLISFVKLVYSPKATITRTDFDISTVPEYIVEIRVKIRDWSSADKDYWNGKYDLHRSTLELFGVHPLQGFFINGRYTGCGSNVYGYYNGRMLDGREAWKIYHPFGEKSEKWRSNCLDGTMQGWDQLPATGDLCIITKSLKDVMVLYQLGIPAVAPQAESNNLDTEKVNELKTRFKNVLILYDNDAPGKKAAEKFSEEFNIPAVYMPEGTKDASDFVELYGVDVLNAYIQDIYELYSNNSQLGS